MLTATDEGYVYAFSAMASPCEVHLDGADAGLAGELGRLVEAEALRIERKFSRYREDSVISTINRSRGWPVEVDEETAALLDYAAHCHAISEGLFDITSGVLRRAWRFDGSDRLPASEAIEDLLRLIGWDKVTWRRPFLTLPQGMELDLGGLGKEYAVDSALQILTSACNLPALVNFGGDLRVSRARAGDRGWRVAIESVEDESKREGVLDLKSGALTTSGDARRFLLKDGIRYSHILDPRTGWPVKDPPRSVTVAAPTCMEAGMLSTLAMLEGAGAEAFLERERLQAWWVR